MTSNSLLQGPLSFLPIAWLLLHAPGQALFAPGSTTLPTAFARTLWSAVVSTLLGTALAACGHFSLSALLCATSVASVVGLFLRRAPVGGGYARPVRDPTGIAILMLALASYWPAWPTFLGASDSTAYLSAGISLAHHGTLGREDSMVRRVPPALKPILFDSMSQVLGNTGPPYRRVPGGMMVDSLDADYAWPNFFPVPIVWAAIFASSSLPGAATPEQGAPGYAPLFAALTLWAFSLVARSWLGTGWGLATTALLGASVPFVVCARMPLSEPIAAFFCWAGLAAIACAERIPAGRDNIIAGAALGTAVVTRMEFGLLLAMAFALRPFLTNNRARATPSLPTPAGPRGWQTKCSLFNTTVLFAAATIPLAIAVPGPWSSHFSDQIRNLRIYWLLFHGTPSPAGLLALVAFVSVLATAVAHRIGWSALLRATLLLGVLVGHAATANALPSRTPMWMSFALGWPVLGLAIVGTSLLATRATQKPAGEFLLALVFSTAAVLIWNPHVYPVVPWGWRRFVPVLLPGTVLFAGVALSAASKLRGRTTIVLAIAALVASAWPVANATRPLVGRDLATGAWDQLAALESAIPHDGIALIDRDISSLMIAPALWLVHDHNNITVPDITTPVGKKVLFSLVHDLGDLGPLYLVTRSAGDKPPLPGIHAKRTSKILIGLRMLEEHYDLPPRRVETQLLPVDIYRLEPSQSPEGEILR